MLRVTFLINIDYLVPRCNSTNRDTAIIISLRKMDLSQILKKHSKHTDNLVYVYTFKSPVGNIIACADQDYLYLVCFEDSKNIDKMFKTVAEKLSCEFVEEKNKILKMFGNELQEYFNGKLKKFTVPIKTFGSEFQKEVWDKLMEIPYGTTQTYGTLAKEMGRSASHSRAVGAACGVNAHLLVIPCHRLVATGSKGGFSSGVDRKEWLIKHEEQFSCNKNKIGQGLTTEDSKTYKEK